MTPIKVEHPLVHAPGVFFGLPEEEYHGSFAQSSSGVKNIRVSAMDFWADSVLNPKRKQRDTAALRAGRAYHKRVVEGRAAFYDLYAAELDRADYPAAIDTIKEIKEAIVEVGGSTRGLPTLKADLIAKLLEYRPDAQIWDRIVAEHAAKHPGRQFLPYELVWEIEMAGAMIENHPKHRKAFTGGAPEVSVFWVDAETGVPCKARFDYVKPQAIIDLKSFANINRHPVDRAVYYATANNKYDIQVAFYIRAGYQMRRLLAEGKIFGRIDAGIVASLRDEQEPLNFVLMFQQKGQAPVTRGRRFNLNGDVYRGAVGLVNFGIARFAECWAKHGPEPWVDEEDDIEFFDDHEFPGYMTAA